MANPIQYGDPGQPDPYKNILYWLGQQYRTGTTPARPGSSMGAVVGGVAEPGVPRVGFGGVQGDTGWVSPEQLASFRQGAGLAGAMGYDPAREMQYMGLGGGALPPTGVGIRRGAGPVPPGGFAPYISDTSLASTVGVNPLLASTQPVQYGPPPPPETRTTPAAGQTERIDYDYIRDVEQMLRDRGETGNTVHYANYDEQGNYRSTDFIRRDNQGRILSITRGVSGKAADLAYRSSYSRSKTTDKPGGLGGGRSPMSTYRRDKKEWEKKQDKSGSSAGSNYPNWVVQMSNWRGI